MRTWKDFIAPKQPNNCRPMPMLVYARQVMKERKRLMELLE